MYEFVGAYTGIETWPQKLVSLALKIDIVLFDFAEEYDWQTSFLQTADIADMMDVLEFEDLTLVQLLYNDIARIFAVLGYGYSETEVVVVGAYDYTVRQHCFQCTDYHWDIAGFR